MDVRIIEMSFDRQQNPSGVVPSDMVKLVYQSSFVQLSGKVGWQFVLFQELAGGTSGPFTLDQRGFERIHRTNLVGMGVLPLEFKNGETRETYAIDGTERFDVLGEPNPRADLTVVMHRANGETHEIPVTCRLDTAEEVSVYKAGGALQRFAQDFLASNAA